MQLDPVYPDQQSLAPSQRAQFQDFDRLSPVEQLSESPNNFWIAQTDHDLDHESAFTEELLDGVANYINEDSAKNDQRLAQLEQENQSLIGQKETLNNDFNNLKPLVIKPTNIISYVRAHFVRYLGSAEPANNWDRNNEDNYNWFTNDFTNFTNDLTKEYLFYQNDIILFNNMSAILKRNLATAYIDASNLYSRNTTEDLNRIKNYGQLLVYFTLFTGNLASYWAPYIAMVIVILNGFATNYIRPNVINNTEINKQASTFFTKIDAILKNQAEKLTYYPSIIQFTPLTPIRRQALATIQSNIAELFTS